MEIVHVVPLGRSLLEPLDEMLWHFRFKAAHLSLPHEPVNNERGTLAYLGPSLGHLTIRMHQTYTNLLFNLS